MEKKPEKKGWFRSLFSKKKPEVAPEADHIKSNEAQENSVAADKAELVPDPR